MESSVDQLSNDTIITLFKSKETPNQKPVHQRTSIGAQDIGLPVIRIKVPNKKASFSIRIAHSCTRNNGLRQIRKTKEDEIKIEINPPKPCTRYHGKRGELIKKGQSTTAADKSDDAEVISIKRAFPAENVTFMFNQGAQTQPHQVVSVRNIDIRGSALLPSFSDEKAEAIPAIKASKEENFFGDTLTSMQLLLLKSPHRISPPNKSKLTQTIDSQDIYNDVLPKIKELLRKNNEKMKTLKKVRINIIETWQASCHLPLAIKLS